MNSLIEGLTSTARKVYEVVPIADAWSSLQVSAELKRIGTPHELRIIQGCLKSLSEQGLVQRLGVDSFQRAKSRAPSEKKESVMPTTLKLTPIDTFAAVADRMRDAAKDMRLQAATLEEQASALETAALQATVGTDAERAEMEKLRALKEALKNL